MIPEGAGPSGCPYQTTHEGLSFISADALPLTHFFLQFSAWFRVPLLADYAFFPLSLPFIHTHLWESSCTHHTGRARTYHAARITIAW